MRICVLGRQALVVGLAVAFLAGCGGAQNGTMPQSAVPQGAPQVETSGGYEAPNVTGTYRGWYIETRNGQTVKGRVRIVVQQKRFKITGPFDIRGHDNRVNTYYVGKVKQSPQGALLRFQVVWLGGYGNSVNVRARVTGATLDGEGQSQVKSGSEASHWKFKATKAS
jgi:hypothetical protein